MLYLINTFNSELQTVLVCVEVILQPKPL